jgi:hypothetical protein
MVIEKKRFKVLLLPGLLGGAVGGLLLAAWLVLSQIDMFQTNWDQCLLIYCLVKRSISNESKTLS